MKTLTLTSDLPWLLYYIKWFDIFEMTDCHYTDEAFLKCLIIIVTVNENDEDEEGVTKDTHAITGHICNNLVIWLICPSNFSHHASWIKLINMDWMNWWTHMHVFIHLPMFHTHTHTFIGRIINFTVI